MKDVYVLIDEVTALKREEQRIKDEIRGNSEMLKEALIDQRMTDYLSIDWARLRRSNR